MFIEIIGVITILMAISYINVIGFCISALVALYIQTPFGLVLAATFFITSTIGSNAIAYTLDSLDDEIIYDKDVEEQEEN